MSYVDPSGSQAWVYLASHLLDLLRNLGWALLMGLATIGACWAGGTAAMAAVTAIRRPASEQEPDPVADEVARGIAEIEAFLTADH